MKESKNTVISWSKHNTLIYCDRHGWVAGRFGKSNFDGMCKTSKYYINYCCGLKCTDEEQKAIYEYFGGDEE